MENRNNASGNETNDMANPGRGPQGIDKAPGEETSTSTANFVANTQKGKNKVDGDPSEQSDQPIENE